MIMLTGRALLVHSLMVVRIITACKQTLILYTWLMWQAVIFLTLEDKQTKSQEDIIRTCPALSMRQLHRIAIMYWDDSCTTQTVSQVIADQGQGRLKFRTTEIMYAGCASARHQTSQSKQVHI